MKYKLLPTIAVLVLIAGLFQFYQLQKKTVKDARVKINIDAPAYYIASKILENKQNPYDIGNVKKESKRNNISFKVYRTYLYPPLFAYLISLMHFNNLNDYQEFLAKLKVVLLFSFGLLFPFFYLRNIKFKDYLLPVGYNYFYMFSAGCFFLSSSIMNPVVADFEDGQVNIIILFLLFWAMVSGNKKSILPGVLVACAGFLKISPYFIVLFFIITKDYRNLISALIFSMVLLVTSIIVTNYEIHIYYFTKILLPFISGSSIPVLEWPLSHYLNQSLKGLLSRLFLESYYGENIGTEVVYFSPVLFKSVSVIINAAFVLFTSRIVFLANRKPGNNRVIYHFGFSVFIAVMPLISPLTWYHHLVVLLLPVSLLFTFSILEKKWNLLAGLMLVVFLFSFEPVYMYGIYYLFPRHIGFSSLNYLKLAGNLVLYFVLIRYIMEKQGIVLSETVRTRNI